MPTREQLESALINADKAGDHAAAKAIANELRAMPEQQTAPVEQEVFNQDIRPQSAQTENVVAPIAIQSNQVAPPIDLKGAIQERLDQRSLLGKSAQSAMAGVNSIVPALAGLPMDTVQNIINLGIAAYGSAKAAAGADVSTLPEPIGPLPMGSEDIKRNISGAMGGDPFAPSDDSKLQQNIHMGSGILGAGLVSPASSVKQAAGNVARMAPAAIGAISAKEAFPDQPLAPVAGMMLGGVAKPAYQTAKAKVTVNPKEAFLKARKLGYRVPPALAKSNMKQQVIEGTAGPVPVKQKASIINQKITNRLIKKDIGYPKDTPLSREGLDAIRLDAGKAYEKVSRVGKIAVDKAFSKEMAKISSKGTALSKEIPGLAKKDVEALVSQFNRGKYSSRALVEAIKQLRADSSAGFRSQDPSTLAMAKAQGKVANALEKLIERGVSKTNPELLNEFRAARKKIAKTYTVEKALKGENVDAVALGRELEKGKPLSGIMKEIAEFGQNFKGAAQVNPPQQTNFRPMDLVAGVGGATVTGNPAWLLAMAARPAARSLILSKPYQARLAKVYPKEISAIQKLEPAAQVTAITALLDKIRSSGTDAQARSQRTAQE